MSSQVNETLKTAETLLGDLSGFSSFKKQASELYDELKSYQKEQFDSWSHEMQSSIDDPNGSLRYLYLFQYLCVVR